MLPMMIEAATGSIFIVGATATTTATVTTAPGGLAGRDGPLSTTRCARCPGLGGVQQARPAGEPGAGHSALHPGDRRWAPVPGGLSLRGLPMHRRLHLFRTFYRLGMRHMHIAHNGRNELADGHNDEITGGRLSEFGVAVVKEANRLGVTITLGHPLRALLVPRPGGERAAGAVHPLQRHGAGPPPAQRDRRPDDKAVAGQGGVAGVHLWTPIQDPAKPNLDEPVGTCSTWPTWWARSTSASASSTATELPPMEPARQGPDPHAREHRVGSTTARDWRCSSSASTAPASARMRWRGILGGNYLRVFRQNLPEHSHATGTTGRRAGQARRTGTAGTAGTKEHSGRREGGERGAAVVVVGGG